MRERHLDITDQLLHKVSHSHLWNVKCVVSKKEKKKRIVIIHNNVDKTSEYKGPEKNVFFFFNGHYEFSWEDHIDNNNKICKKIFIIFHEFSTARICTVQLYFLTQWLWNQMQPNWKLFSKWSIVTSTPHERLICLFSYWSLSRSVCREREKLTKLEWTYISVRPWKV